MEDPEDTEVVSSEIRYITIELMKIASREKKSFSKVASEFIGNAYALNSLIEESIAMTETFRKEKTDTR
ncbi:MAG: hypothetical protein NTY68_00795 [Candidatus Micrarchaeota archaeon]|nr:hypothetical protein [Candidatus Micrarchaeota archaeon]